MNFYAIHVLKREQCAVHNGGAALCKFDGN